MHACLPLTHFCERRIPCSTIPLPSFKNPLVTASQGWAAFSTPKNKMHHSMQAIGQALLSRSDEQGLDSGWYQLVRVVLFYVLPDRLSGLNVNQNAPVRMVYVPVEEAMVPRRRLAQRKVEAVLKYEGIARWNFQKAITEKLRSCAETLTAEWGAGACEGGTRDKDGMRRRAAPGRGCFCIGLMGAT
ncbi:hypothetical protein KCU87_g423, partial [Aureobasidium melanogenum]